ncbi:unnamed protein product [Rotaria sordida]|uniref:Uncharacterized protein n=1 Tax=Rotaria sordida TaxID=392033 RepID=A0A814HE12_9BILA|nr:unnamed protein product [Rotaria sordida]CAF3808053.1 unnamed protein product [Rotaria sordida]
MASSDIAKGRETFVKKLLETKLKSTRLQQLRGNVSRNLETQQHLINACADRDDDNEKMIKKRIYEEFEQQLLVVDMLLNYVQPINQSTSSSTSSAGNVAAALPTATGTNIGTVEHDESSADGTKTT